MATEKRLIDLDAMFPKESLEEQIRRTINAPTVDAVPVVRCKDCIHYKPQNQGAHRNCTTPYCMRVVAVKVKPDDFCSYGERRTDNEEKLR